ncbi:class I SAM-dependent methyltransferase [Rhodococcus spongiicola]|uniref:Class I SAM-dependent methyltransferase n=1 Tax=Rhodococcus spongiicola TaxID=2487352 RepID=A0A3S3DWV0_9NOCA|nr:class I SAM-dependent methyltransferase [Rhodococcus spongiicola]RVW00883.1 class I SAM-dependent methyltransferase [Rhodococcus spongiicola]
MNANASQPTTPPSPNDFEALYRGDYDALNLALQASSGAPHAEFQIDRIPWDIGEVQPVVRDLEADGQITDEVLDIGCGTGENAMFLAGRGYRVCGLDAAPAAIEIARERARLQELDEAVEFDVADATDLTGYADRFATVIDSALYHCFPEEQRPRYVAEVYRACRPGARLHVACFSDQVPDELPGPYRISEGNLRNTLTNAGWSIARLERTTYTTATTRRDIERQPATALSAIADRLSFDSHDRLLAPAWLATAERR